MENRQISINVGGQVFYTSTAVLRSIPNSLLSDLVDPSVPLEQAVAFPEKGFRHGVGGRDLKVYDTTPDVNSSNPEMGKGGTDANPAQKERLDRAKFVYLSCNSVLRRIRENQPFTRASSPSSSTSTPSASASPKTLRPHFPEHPSTFSPAAASTPSHPPPYLSMSYSPALPMYYPVANALSSQAVSNLDSDKCQLEKENRDKDFDMNGKDGQTREKNKTGGEKGGIDQYPVLYMDPHDSEAVPCQPAYVEPGKDNYSFQDSSISYRFSNEQDHSIRIKNHDTSIHNSKHHRNSVSPSRLHHKNDLNYRNNARRQQTKQVPTQEYDLSSGQHPQSPHKHQSNVQMDYQQSMIYFPFPPACHADIYVDRNPTLMPFILDAYRIGQLHLPSNVCSLSVRCEMDFWKLPEDLICECCWENYHRGLKTMGVVNTIIRAFYSLYDDPRARAALSWPGKIWLIMERPSYSWVGKVWALIYYSCIFLSCILFGLLTVEGLNEPKEEFKEYAEDFNRGNFSFRSIHMVTFTKSILPVEILELFLAAFFFLELLVRFITCPNKWEFVADIHNIIDTFVVFVTWVRTIMDRAVAFDSENFTFTRSYILVCFYCLMGSRVLRVFHLAKTLSTLRIMYLSTKESSKELFLLVVTLSAGVLLFGTAMFLVEALALGANGHLVFSNVPTAMWWAVITLTTVGYGDYVPTHTGGYLVGTACAIVGLLLVAMPIAIVANNFSSYHDNMTSRNQSIRRGLLMAKIKHLRTENLLKEMRDRRGKDVEGSEGRGQQTGGERERRRGEGEGGEGERGGGEERKVGGRGGGIELHEQRNEKGDMSSSSEEIACLEGTKKGREENCGRRTKEMTPVTERGKVKVKQVIVKPSQTTVV